MNQNILLAVVASVGLVAGAGGTYLVTSEPKVEAQAISKAELVAAISADLSLCPIPTVEAPSGAEATAAYRKAHAASPLVWDRNNMLEISVALVPRTFLDLPKSERRAGAPLLLPEFARGSGREGDKR